MKDTYKILVVDDSESDRGICRRYLMTDENCDYQILEAETLEEALELWRSEAPDLVLTDIHLPDGSGLELLEAIKKTHPRQNFPVIMMTGQGDERLAVEAMKLGASDYLVKNDITASGLCRVVRQGMDKWTLPRQLMQLQQQLASQNVDLIKALDTLKVRKEFNQLIAEINSRFVEVHDETFDVEIERSLQLIGEKIQVETGYLFTLDRDHQTVNMSHEWSQPGSLRQIAIAQNIPFAAFPYSIALILQQKVCCVNDTELLPTEAAVDAASWQQFNIKSLLFIPLTQKRETVGFIGFASFRQAVAWDEEIIQVLTVLSQTLANTQARITAENIRKQNENTLAQWRKRYELAEQASGQMIYEYNFLTNSVIWGANASLIVGYAEPDLPHHLSEWFTLIHPEDLSLFQQALETATTNKTPFFCQYRFLHQAGHYVWLEDCNQWLLDEQGERIGVIGMITDISDKKKVELLLRKQALVFENIIDGVIITDTEGMIIDWNRGAESLYGYTKAEILGKSPSLLHTPEDSQWLQTDILQTTLQNGFWSGEIAVICKDGSKKITTTSTILLKDDQKNNIAVIGLNHDITKLKQTQEELRQSNEELEQLNKTLEVRVKERTYELETREAELFDLFDNATDLIQRVSPEGKLLFVNRAWRESLGYCDHDLEQLSIFQIIHPSDLEHCQAMMARIFAGEPCIGMETRFLTKDGKEIIVQGNVNCQFQDGQAIATRGIFRDISDRKRMELNLQQSEKINLAILETIPDLLIHMDAQGNYIRKSQGQNVRVIGLEDPSLQVKVENILPSHLAQQQIYFANLALETGTLQIFEQIVDFPDEQRFEEVRIAPLNAQEVLVIIRDITDRKLAEKALKASERRFSTLVSTSPVGIFRFDRPLNCVYVNERWCEITGRSAASAMGRGWIDAIHPDERDFFREHIDHDFYSPSPQQRMLTGEGRHLRPDGSINWCYFQAVHEFNESGEVIGYIGTVTDITDRKQAEQQLQNLTDRLKIALNSGAIGFWEWDIVNSIVTWDEQMYKLYGIPGETTVVFETFVNSLYPDDRQATLTLVQEAVVGKAEYDTEFRVIHPDGSIHFLKCYGVVVRDDQGNPLRIIGVNFEITEQKRAEQTIRQQIEKETLLRQITQHMRETLDLQTIFDTACQEIRQFIHSDRVGIFKFYADSGFDDGEFVAESVKEGLSSVLAIRVHDHCFGENYSERYTKGHFQSINDVLQSDLQDCHKAILSQFEIRANLVIPLLLGEKLWGLLCIHTCAAPRIWQPDEIDLIQQIAGQLAIAIQQGNLYNQIQAELMARQQIEEKIRLELRRKQLLGEIIQSIRDSLDMTEILANVTQKIQKVLDSDRVIVFQLFSDGRSQIVEESVSDPFPHLKNLYWEDEAWPQEILDYYWQGIPRIVPDVMNDRWTDCLMEYSIEGQIQSKIVAPILQEATNNETHRWVSSEKQDKLWGVLVVYACAEKRVWQDEEAEILQQIANQLAIAIQQANLFKQLQKEQQKLTQTNEALTQSNENLARATRLKDEFLANMSHELRTPLTAILGMSEALQENTFGNINPAQEKAIKLIEKSGDHLLSLINDILDLSKIEAGKLELKFASTSVKTLCENSTMFVRQMAFNKKIELETRIAENIDQIRVDELRIRQSLINLLSNAIKFTPQGGNVILSVELEEQEIVFSVTDTGIGISPTDLDKLFQPFIQIDSSLNRQYAGTGLGLVLVERIITKHGGRVSVTSRVGEGSCFTLRLPYVPSSRNIIPEGVEKTSLLPNETNPPLSVYPLILLADDNEANRQTLDDYLSNKGYRILLAYNGKEALEIVKTHRPDLILMDIQMPEMDGLEATTLIRSDPAIAHIPIIALTALAFPEQADQCFHAGFDDYLMKPVRFKILMETIQKFCHR